VTALELKQTHLVEVLEEVLHFLEQAAQQELLIQAVAAVDHRDQTLI
jgi:hypothetical protein